MFCCWRIEELDCFSVGLEAAKKSLPGSKTSDRLIEKKRYRFKFMFPTGLKSICSDELVGQAHMELMEAAQICLKWLACANNTESMSE